MKLIMACLGILIASAATELRAQSSGAVTVVYSNGSYTLDTSYFLYNQIIAQTGTNVYGGNLEAGLAAISPNTVISQVSNDGTQITGGAYISFTVGASYQGIGLSVTYTWSVNANGQLQLTWTATIGASSYTGTWNSQLPASAVTGYHANATTKPISGGGGGESSSPSNAPSGSSNGGVGGGIAGSPSDDDGGGGGTSIYYGPLVVISYA